MSANFTKTPFETVLTVNCIFTLFYMELSKDFAYPGEQHDFWEMVYMDKGEMICTAGENRVTLRSGELTFHKPNEYHNLQGNKVAPPNVSIITFECRDPAMEFFAGKIFKLTPEEKGLLSDVFEEGLSCYQMADASDPLRQEIVMRKEAPFGGSQATKNLLELFLIKLCRNGSASAKSERRNAVIDGRDVPYQIKSILDYMQDHLQEKITLEDIAYHMHQSESQVKKLFSRYYDGGVMRYYNRLKIKEARRLIREGQMNMAQIAETLCFDNPQYFTKCFTRFSHMTPSQYKRSIVEKQPK